MWGKESKAENKYQLVPLQEETQLVLNTGDTESTRPDVAGSGDGEIGP